MRIPVVGLGVKTLLIYVALTLAGIFGLSLARARGLI